MCADSDQEGASGLNARISTQVCGTVRAEARAAEQAGEAKGGSCKLDMLDVCSEKGPTWLYHHGGLPEVDNDHTTLHLFDEKRLLQPAFWSHLFSTGAWL